MVVQITFRSFSQLLNFSQQRDPHQLDAAAEGSGVINPFPVRRPKWDVTTATMKIWNIKNGHHSSVTLPIRHLAKFASVAAHDMWMTIVMFTCDE